MNIKKIAQIWVHGLFLGVKIAFAALLVKYVSIFIIGVAAAFSGPLPGPVAMTLVGIAALLLVPFCIVLLSKLLNIENSSRQEIEK